MGFPGGLTTWHAATATATVTNNGPNAAQDVTVAETLPGSFLSGKITASHGSCSGAGTIVCDPGTVPAGPSVTVHVPITSTAAGTFTSAITAATENSAAVVLWNGSPRTTTYLDAQHVKVAVPGADISADGSVKLTSENPGSGLSNAIDLKIDQSRQLRRGTLGTHGDETVTGK